MPDRKPYEPPRLTYLGTERPELWPEDITPDTPFIGSLDPPQEPPKDVD